MGKINMGIFYGKKYNSGNRTFSLENGENFIEGTGLIPRIETFLSFMAIVCDFLFMGKNPIIEGTGQAFQISFGPVPSVKFSPFSSEKVLLRELNNFP